MVDDVCFLLIAKRHQEMLDSQESPIEDYSSLCVQSMAGGYTEDGYIDLMPSMILWLFDRCAH